MSKKELRFTKPYLVGYTVLKTIGKLFGFLKIYNYSIYVRELRAIIRTGMWSLFVKKIGKGSKIDSGVRIRYNPQKLEIGNYTHIDVGVNFEIHDEIKIGKFVHIAPNAYIQSGNKVIIEDYAGVGNGSKIYAKSNTYEENANPPTLTSGNAPVHRQKYVSKPIHIKKNAFIGMNVIVLPGVTIGENSKIGSGSTVTTDIPDNVIAVGCPARPIKKLNHTPKDEK